MCRLILSAHLTRAQDMGYRNIEQVALVSCKTKEGVPELRKFITELAKSKMKVPLLRIAVSKQEREREREPVSALNAHLYLRIYFSLAVLMARRRNSQSTSRTRTLRVWKCSTSCARRTFSCSTGTNTSKCARPALCKRLHSGFLPDTREGIAAAHDAGPVCARPHDALLPQPRRGHVVRERPEPTRARYTPPGGGVTAAFSVMPDSRAQWLSTHSTWQW